VLCVSLQLFANQTFDSNFFHSALHSVLASGAAWARDLHDQTNYLTFPLMALAMAGIVSDLGSQRSSIKPPLPLPPPPSPPPPAPATSSNLTGHKPPNHPYADDSNDPPGGSCHEERQPHSRSAAAGALVDVVVCTALVLYLAVFHALAAIPDGVSDPALYREVHGRFWMLPNLLASFVAGVGLARGARLLDRAGSESD